MTDGNICEQRVRAESRRLVTSETSRRAALFGLVVASLVIGGCAQLADVGGGLVGGPDRSLSADGTTFDASTPDLGGLRRAFVDAITASRNSSSTNAAARARTMLTAGHALGRANCVGFFDRIGRAQQKQDINKSYLSLGSNVVTGLLGLADAGRGAVLGSALAFESLESNLDIRQLHVLFNPDTKAVEDLVLQAVDTQIAADVAEADAGSLTYVTAYSMLVNFERTCQVHFIRSLVNSAIERSELVAVPLDGLNRIQELLTSETTTRLKRDVAKTMGQSNPVTSTNLTLLYWLSVKGAEDTHIQKTICPALISYPQGPCKGPDGSGKYTVKSDREFAYYGALSGLFLRVQPELRAWLEGEVTEIANLQDNPSPEFVRALRVEQRSGDRVPSGIRVRVK